MKRLMMGLALVPCMALATTLNDGLVAWYKLDGDTKDSSDNENEMKVSGASSYCEDRHGKASAAFLLDGNTCLYASNWIRLETNYTFACWFKATEETKLCEISTTGITGTSKSIKYLCGATDFPVAVGTNGINVFEHADYFLPAVFKYESAIGTEWHHLAITVSDNQNANIYLDGVSIGGFSKLTSHYPAVLALGNYDQNMELKAQGIASFSYGGHFSGGIDNMYFYSRALQDSEVKALYDGYSWTYDVKDGEAKVVGISPSDPATPPMGTKVKGQSQCD